MQMVQMYKNWWCRHHQLTSAQQHAPDQPQPRGTGVERLSGQNAPCSCLNSSFLPLSCTSWKFGFRLSGTTVRLGSTGTGREPIGLGTGTGGADGAGGGGLGLPLAAAGAGAAGGGGVAGAVV